jgi:hypothetical protein
MPGERKTVVKESDQKLTGRGTQSFTELVGPQTIDSFWMPGERKTVVKESDQKLTGRGTQSFTELVGPQTIDSFWIKKNSPGKRTIQVRKPFKIWQFPVDFFKHGNASRGCRNYQ